MKKIGLLLCLAFYFCNSQAQDTTLKQYVGTYRFPDGSFVPSAEVTLKDTVLNISSVQGASDLLQRGHDTFALTSYDGTAYFKRDETGKVTGIKVAVEDVLVEGTKDSSNAAPVQKQPAAATKQWP